MIAIIISVLGMLFGYPALIPLNKTKVANFSVLYAGFLQLGIILVAYFLNIKFTALFIACSYLSCEIFVLLLRYIVFHNAYKNIKTHE